MRYLNLDCKIPIMIKFTLADYVLQIILINEKYIN